MPRATLSTTTERFELATCPEGYVDIRRMSYGRWLERQEMALKVQFTQTKGKGMTGNVDALQRITTAFEFKECVVDHNLTDENDQPLNFASPTILAVLDSRIGNEIEMIIKDLHEVDEEGKSSSSSTAS